MKSILAILCSIAFAVAGKAQLPGNIEAILKYPDELVADQSLMNYTIYKTNTSIACRYQLRQVYKTMHSTVFMSNEDSLKMSFAFFDFQKLPFYSSSDSLDERAYKFYAWDSAARVRAHLPAITILERGKSEGLLYYREITGTKTKFYLVGVRGDMISLMLVSGKGLDFAKLAPDMKTSFVFNARE